MRGKRGFTLVETIVTLLIFVLVVTVTATLMLSGTSLFARSAGAKAYQLIGDGVFDWMVKEITYATHLSIGGGSYEKTFLITDGRLYCGDAENEPYDFFGEEFYSGCTVSYTALADETGCLLTLEVLVLRPDGGVGYRRGSTIRLVNMGIAGNFIESEQDGDSPPLRFDEEPLG